MGRFSLTLEDEAREVVSWLFRSKEIHVEVASAELGMFSTISMERLMDW